LSIIETLVVFAGIPLAVVAVIMGLVYAGGARSNDRRYRPGRPFEFTPVWFLSAPEQQVADQHGSGRPAPAGTTGRDVSGANRLALTKADAQADADPGAAIADVTGGASDRW
jgi:hypothetical protein